MTELQTTLKSLQPTLYELAEDGHSLNFFYAECRACGGLNFPANVPGCVHCGDPLNGSLKLTLPATGTLLEYVTLHVPLSPGMAVPKIAGDIQLAKGIVEEGVIAVHDEATLKPGLALKAVAQLRKEDGVYGCQFVPIDGEAAQ